MNIANGGKGLGLALCGMVVAAGCSRESPAPPELIRPVKTMTVGAGGGSYTRTFPGRVEAAKSVDLAFQVPGLVVRLPVKEGQRVRRGQVVSRLRQSEYAARRLAAQGQLDQGKAVLEALRTGERTEEQLRREAALRAAEAKLANTRTEFERYKRLLPTGAVSTSEYDLSQTAYSVAQEEQKAAKQMVEKGVAARQEEIAAQEGQVRSLEGRLDEAKVLLSDTILRAPYNGVIAQRLIDEGQAITANRPVVKFQNTDEVDVVADVPEAVMAAGFRHGTVSQMVAEFPKAPGLRVPVRVTEMAQVADPATQTFQVRFGMRPPKGILILPGMTAQVTVTYPRSTQASGTFVPITAVTRQPDGRQVVWVVGADGTVRSRAVVMGAVKDGDVEIVTGLNAGDRIAIAGTDFLRDGMKVRELGNALGDSRQ